MVAMGRWAFAFLLLMGVAELAAARVPNIDARGEASSGGRDLLHSRRLVMKKANEVNKDLIIAASEGNAKAIKKAIAGGADIESKHGDQEDTALTIAAHAGHLAAVKALIDAGANVSAADTEGAGEAMASQLIASGANVDAATATGLTPLMVAARVGNVPVAMVLREAGADAGAEMEGGVKATDQICGCLEDGEGESACLEGVCGEASKKETVEKIMEILA
eukprot:evm.model.scf_147.1 EVM.evm.TU.scf_147.1   scf_147:6855-13475(-)